MFGLLAIKLLGLHWMRAPRRAQLFSYNASLQAPFSVSTTKIFNRSCVRTLFSHLRLTDFGDINATVGKRLSSRIVNKQCTFFTVNSKDEPSTHTAHSWSNCVNVLSRLTLVTAGALRNACRTPRMASAGALISYRGRQKKSHGSH